MSDSIDSEKKESEKKNSLIIENAGEKSVIFKSSAEETEGKNTSQVPSLKFSDENNDSKESSPAPSPKSSPKETNEKNSESSSESSNEENDNSLVEKFTGISSDSKKLLDTNDIPAKIIAESSEKFETLFHVFSLLSNSPQDKLTVSGFKKWLREAHMLEIDEMPESVVDRIYQEADSEEEGLSITEVGDVIDKIAKHQNKMAKKLVERMCKLKSIRVIVPNIPDDANLEECREDHFKMLFRIFSVGHNRKLTLPVTLEWFRSVGLLGGRSTWCFPKGFDVSDVEETYKSVASGKKKLKMKKFKLLIQLLAKKQDMQSEELIDELNKVKIVDVQIPEC